MDLATAVDVQRAADLQTAVDLPSALDLYFLNALSLRATSPVGPLTIAVTT